MSDPEPASSVHTTVVQAGLKLGTSVVSNLSPQFLTLILVNLLFMAVLYWYIGARAQHTAALIDKLLTACLQARG